MEKTLTLKAFEKKLDKEGFEFEIKKQTKNETWYLISKDTYKCSFIAFNVLDDKKGNWDLFNRNWEYVKLYKDKTGEDLV